MSRPARQPVPDRHYLYSTAVQSPEADLGFFKRVWRAKRGGRFTRLREDFCGTALLAHEWVRRGAEHRAWGVDLDRATLEWGRKHYTPRLGRRASQLALVNGNVLEVREPRVDVVAALNFSYSVFHTRAELRNYFRQVRRSLGRTGLFFIDAWGGTDVMRVDSEPRKIPAETGFDGTKLPAFTYVWEQTRFNPVDHRILCHIHFKLRGGRRLKRAFTYDWRLWTLPELAELLHEAGFASSEVYVDGWDDETNQADGIFRRTSCFENQAGWVAYVVGVA